MRRDPAALARAPYDLVVVGGGIHGAATAWDAALRGLRVALIEQDDFGAATSANSLKLIHGGMRLLARGDVAGVRLGMRERRIALQTAPHLVRPLPVVAPCYRDGRGAGRPSVWRAASRLHNALTLDRNLGACEGRRVSPSRWLSASDVVRLAPCVRRDGLLGGLLWFDAQVASPERLTLAVVQSAVWAGADAANYVRAVGVLSRLGQVTGLTVEDRLSARRFEMRARTVVNAAGPWIDRVLGRPLACPRLVKAINLVVDPLPLDAAIGLPGRSGRRWFLAPWQGATLIGTAYLPSDGNTEHLTVSDEEAAGLLAEVRASSLDAELDPDAIRFVHAGLLPAREDQRGRSAPAAVPRIVDHAAHGFSGLVSLVGVKMTTARVVAERVVDRLLQRMGRPVLRSHSRYTPLFGGRIARLEEFLEQSLSGRDDMPAMTLRRLITRYGTAYSDVLRLAASQPAWAAPLAATDALAAEVVYAVREEMAVTLEDVVMRRIGLTEAGHPGHEALAACATHMAALQQWTPDQSAAALRDLQHRLARVRMRLPQEPRVPPTMVGALVRTA